MFVALYPYITMDPCRLSNDMKWLRAITVTRHCRRSSSMIGGKMDVKTAFINKKLTEDVFMAQQEGFENAKYPKRVCKLQKAIYRLK
ncbi:retrotransposon protein, putative, ty1-copia subclass [Tanacetum coccineum]|uniref:Retrotransposon protein, putative, ty1-copia subclass n=1 Tax=Tanacetum coccineum TaxID=301880 RepID=A0ABQ5CDC3_9ASTR